MKEHIKDKSNNEILMLMKNWQVDYDTIKTRMLKDYDLLESIEKKYNEANLELVNRLKGEK